MFVSMFCAPLGESLASVAMIVLRTNRYTIELTCCNTKKDTGFIIMYVSALNLSLNTKRKELCTFFVFVLLCMQIWYIVLAILKES